MKILHVITRLILGGAQQNTVMCCAAQVAAGHEVHLAFGPVEGPEGSLIAEANAAGAVLHVLPNMVRSVSPRRDWKAKRELQALIREIKPDVVHTHSSKAGIVGRAAAWAERNNDRPKVIHTVHGLPFHGHQSKAVHRLYVTLERWAAKRCDHLIAITPAMVEAFVAKRIAGADRFTVIPSGVDVSLFEGETMSRASAKEALGLAADTPTIGLVARLDPLKGHRDLLAALPTIRQAIGDAVVLFVGDGYDGGAIQGAVDDAGLGDVVKFGGLRDWREMPRLYRAIDVLALPSYQEGQSRVLVEGLLSGCAIVGYDVGGIPSVCVDGQTGRLVPVGDTAALGEAIIELLTHEDERKRLAEAGRVHVAEHFSAERMNRELLALYERLVENKS